MSDGAYVKKSSARNIIVGIFIFYLLALGLGLQFVKVQAANDAARIATVKATHLAYLTSEATRYNANKQTCSLRALVDPQITADEKLIKTYVTVGHDPTQSHATRVANLNRAAATSKAATALINFRAVYATIPPEYNCKHLPKNPPPLATNGGYK